MLPFVLLLVFNVVNFGYFFLVALNLAAASRTAVEYSVQGFASPAATVLPGAAIPSSVQGLAFEDLRVLDPSQVSVRVCSPITSQSCACRGPSCGSLSGTPAPDPEPSFTTQQVDVVYTFKPLITGTIFNLPLRASAMCNASGTCTFIRHAQMRAMN